MTDATEARERVEELVAEADKAHDNFYWEPGAISRARAAADRALIEWCERFPAAAADEIARKEARIQDPAAGEPPCDPDDVAPAPNTVVVTRHPALIEYLAEKGLVPEACTVLEHATAKDVRGKHVIGVLPHSLSCEAETLTEIPLLLPPELRGKELTLEQVRQYAGEPASYMVRQV